MTEIFISLIAFAFLGGIAVAGIGIVGVTILGIISVLSSTPSPERDKWFRYMLIVTGVGGLMSAIGFGVCYAALMVPGMGF